MPDAEPRIAASPAAVRRDARTAQLLGVDFVPVYRARTPLESPGAPAPSAPATPPDPELSMPVVPAGPAVARDRARAQAQLDAILARYERDAPHQHFVTAHSRIVFGEGDPCARLMFIGEAPGADEDRTGRPFVGRAGQLLERQIRAMGLSREQVYITNVLKTRPPNNATPTLDEAARCAPYLYEQIEAVAPDVIVTLGLPATRLLLQTDAPMGRLRGRWSELLLGPLTVPVMPTYHPAYLLRNYTAEERRKVWSDLQQVMARLGLAPAASPDAGGGATESP